MALPCAYSDKGVTKGNAFILSTMLMTWCSFGSTNRGVRFISFSLPLTTSRVSSGATQPYLGKSLFTLFLLGHAMKRFQFK